MTNLQTNYKNNETLQNDGLMGWKRQMSDFIFHKRCVGMVSLLTVLVK